MPRPSMLLLAAKWTVVVAIFPTAAILSYGPPDVILGVTLLSVCLGWIGAVCEIRGRNGS